MTNSIGGSTPPQPTWKDAATNAAKGGALASVVVGTVTPLLYAKNRAQTGNRFIFGECMKGAPLLALNVVPQAVVTFGARQIIAQKFYGKEPSELTMKEKMVATFCGGFLSGVASNPGEFVVQNYQNGWQNSVWKVATVATKEHGIFVLMRGALKTGLREGKYPLGYFVLNRWMSDQVQPYIANKSQRDFAGAIGSAGVVAVATTPVDTLRANQQWMDRNWSTVECVRKLGIRGLFAGVGARFGAVAVATVIMGKGSEYFGIE